MKKGYLFIFLAFLNIQGQPAAHLHKGYPHHGMTKPQFPQLQIRHRMQYNLLILWLHYPKRLSASLSYSPLSIPILHYLSPINNSHLSDFILYIFPSGLGSALMSFLVQDGLAYFLGVSCIIHPLQMSHTSKMLQFNKDTNVDILV